MSKYWIISLFGKFLFIFDEFVAIHTVKNETERNAQPFSRMF